jgi:hypothetical protein
MERQELDWKQYELNILTYRNYLELTLKINIFYYAITGAILSFYFAHSDKAIVRFSLLLPLAMSVLFMFLFAVGAFLARHTRTETRQLGGQLGFKFIPETGILIILLAVFAILMFLVSIGLLLLIFCPCISN